MAANGFTATAKTLAQMKGIDLFRLLDTETVEWRRYISVPALVRNLRLKWRPLFEGLPEGVEASLLSDETTLFASDGSPQQTVRELVLQLWKFGVIPERPGKGRHSASSGPPVFVRVDGRLISVAVIIEAEVWQDWFLGDLPLTVVRGFTNEIDGSFRAERFATDWLRFDEVEQCWQRIVSPDDLSVKPILTLFVKDAPAGDPHATKSVRVAVTPATDKQPPTECAG